MPGFSDKVTPKGGILIDGTKVRNMIEGGFGDDELRGSAGNDLLVGGAGTDTASYSETRSRFTVFSADDIEYVVSKDRGTTDRLFSVEQINFKNMLIKYLNKIEKFDVGSYIASHPDLIKKFGRDKHKALEHYLENGHGEGRAVTFDAGAYLASYGDLIRWLGWDPAAATEHYVRHGHTEGRKATFDSLAYVASHGDLIEALGADADAGDASGRGRPADREPRAAGA